MHRFVRVLCLLARAGLFALILVGLPLTVRAQAGKFTVSESGKAVGTASYNFVKTPEGLDSSSVVQVSMQGLDYQLSKTERLSHSNKLLHVQLSAIINSSAVHVTAAPDPAQILINISANGRSATTRLDAHASAVFLPDFDPGALETLLALAANNNNRDLWAIVPKQSGSIEPIQLATLEDEQGRLDGTSISVHHLVATIAGADTHIFSGPKNQLLQAELPQQGFALVRNGFVLTPPARPLAAPTQ